MPTLSTSPQRGGAGIGLRGLARILLVSWLFTLLVCFYSDSHQMPTDVIKDTTVAQELNGLEHSDSAQDADACCTIMQNLPIFYKMGDINAPLKNLAYVLLPYIFIFQSALLVTAGVCFICADPPGKPRRTLTANILWPNAPPR